MQSMEAGRVIYLIHYTLVDLMQLSYQSIQFKVFQFLWILPALSVLNWSELNKYWPVRDSWRLLVFQNHRNLCSVTWYDMTTWFLIKIIRINNNRNALYMIVWMLYVSLELCGLAIGIRVRFLMFSNIELNSRIATWETFQRSNDHL